MIVCFTEGTETTCNMNQKLYYHVVGTTQSEDILVAEFPDHPKWHSGVTVSLNLSSFIHLKNIWKLLMFDYF